MLTLGKFYLAALVVASVSLALATIGSTLLSLPSFPVACAVMVLLSFLLILVGDDSRDATRSSSRPQSPAAHSNHLQSSSNMDSGSSHDRDTRDANNSNCILTHSDVQLPTSAVHTAAHSGFRRVPLQTELRRPPLGGRHTGTFSDRIQTPARTLPTSRSGVLIDSSRSHQQLLLQFHRVTAGFVISVMCIWIIMRIVYYTPCIQG